MKTSTTYYFSEDRQMAVENRSENTGLLMTEKCMTNALHTLLLKSGWENNPNDSTAKSVWNNAKAQTYIGGKLVREVKLKPIN